MTTQAHNTNWRAALATLIAAAIGCLPIAALFALGSGAGQ
jgi:hypothetical protein